MKSSADSEEKWTLDAVAYRDWLRDRASLGPDLNLLKPTIRSAIFLALLEQNAHCSYKEIHQVLEKHHLISSRSANVSISIPTLRVALSDLAKKLKTTNHYLRLKTEKVGRESRFWLAPKDDHDSAAELVGFTTTKIESPEITDPQEIARHIFDEGGLPFASLYSTYRAAAQWLVFSSKQSRGKKKYEGDALGALDLRKFFEPEESDQRIGLVALAPGEGLGEIEILDNLLRKEKLKVDYLALDTSDILLSSHSKLVNGLFSEEIKNRHLVYTPFVGNLYKLKAYLALVRIRRDPCFLSHGPIICTFFGNCLGNDENKEWEFFKAVLDGFETEKPLIILVGVSLLRREGKNEKGSIINEKYTLDPFLLETPKHLLYDLQLLKSLTPTGAEIPDEKNDEFIYALHKRKKPDYILPEDYSTPHGIRGKVYRFYYTLKHKLTTRDGHQMTERGGKILLYSIVKYELDTLTDFLKTKGFEIRCPAKGHECLTIAEGEEQFKYTVFAAIRGNTT